MTMLDSSDNKEVIALKILEHYYLNDSRPFCLAFSGGKDSSAVLYLTIQMLHSLLARKIKLSKTIYIINSNTLAELPPVLKHLKSSLANIEQYRKENNLPIIVKEVTPELKNTLNVQLLGVGLPPPNTTFRWCTDKLKVLPIDKEIAKNFSDGKFISVLGTRRDESFARDAKIEKRTVKGTDLKLNDRYPAASNLMPIEEWSTKNVWEYLFKQTNDLINIDFLWKLYSDASSKNASECSFVGAGGKKIEEGQIGCGTSRFGCWQCYMVRDKDKSLDGLMQSGHENINLYKEYRDWFWKTTQQGWEKTRDAYSHKTQQRDLYNKGDSNNPKLGMTMPKGLTLQIRKESLKRLLILQNKLHEQIITLDEIKLIQQRWLDEGDIELTALKLARKHNIKIQTDDVIRKLRLISKNAKDIYRQKLYQTSFSKKFSILTLKRFAVQYTQYPQKVEKKFFPSKEEEKHIRKEWRKNSKLISTNERITLLNYLET